MLDYCVYTEPAEPIIRGLSEDSESEWATHLGLSLELVRKPITLMSRVPRSARAFDLEALKQCKPANAAGVWATAEAIVASKCEDGVLRAPGEMAEVTASYAGRSMGSRGQAFGDELWRLRGKQPPKQP